MHQTLRNLKSWLIHDCVGRIRRKYSSRGTNNFGHVSMNGMSGQQQCLFPEIIWNGVYTGYPYQEQSLEITDLSWEVWSGDVWRRTGYHAIQFAVVEAIWFYGHIHWKDGLEKTSIWKQQRLTSASTCTLRRKGFHWEFPNIKFLTWIWTSHLNCCVDSVCAKNRMQKVLLQEYVSWNTCQIVFCYRMLSKQHTCKKCLLMPPTRRMAGKWYYKVFCFTKTRNCQNKRFSEF